MSFMLDSVFLCFDVICGYFCAMDSPSDLYLSISGPAKGTYRELGSKFLAFAFPVETEAEVKKIVADIRKEYFDARHHCYAYRLGADGSKWRANDDGEPSSTAGKPIHGQLLSNSLSDILIVVVRYFGGTKLGVPGLIRAYRTAAQEAIAASIVIEKIASERFRVEFDYLQMNSVMKVMKEMGLAPSGQEYGEKCSLYVRVRLTAADAFRAALADFAEVTVSAE